MAIVYIHRRISNNEIFYIGIGKKESRAYSIKMRNKHWNYIVEKDKGFNVEILFIDLSNEDAYRKEKELITLYGRKDLGKGTLVNFTDGGEGLVNPNKESRLRISNANKRPKPWSKERLDNYIPFNKGKKGIQVSWKKGLKGLQNTKEHNENISKATKGKKKKPFTEEHKKNLAFKKPKVICEFCNKELSIQNYMKYKHNIGNCKQKLKQ